ncbi:U-scoloptoxin(01)-Cw1a-like [Portunus trituberculatus]|uniref:U-scoloptoxin(01)-Cw1a-like n=1 Tax=Portunus trituberculatus TaxID=210409 RepID=UPI001E1CE32E|nr:U-scoloptoxin(01)-Cw1a-like [Portunus trituberculatus]
MVVCGTGSASSLAVAVAAALLCVVAGDSSPSDFELPSNSTVINGGPIVTGFSCDGLPYGYYADVNNGCRIFHVCYPYLDAEQFLRTRMFSFICGLGAVFNQEALVCDHAEHSIPCEDSPNYYDSSNGYFGQTEVNFRE